MVIDRDLLALADTDPQAIAEAKVLMTMLDGEAIWVSPDFR